MLVRPDLRSLTRAANPCVFVVGAARSGTTLLQRMLDAHHLLAVVNETYCLAGLVHWLHPAGLTPRAVAGALAYVADTPQYDLVERITSLAHAGVHTTADLLSELLPRAAAFPNAKETVHASW